MEIYTIRILYRDREHPAKLVGLPEGEEIAGKRGFVNMRGLWRLLNTSDPGKDRGGSKSSEERERIRAGGWDLIDLGSFFCEE